MPMVRQEDGRQFVSRGAARGAHGVTHPTCPVVRKTRCGNDALCGLGVFLIAAGASHHAGTNHDSESYKKYRREKIYNEEGPIQQRVLSAAIGAGDGSAGTGGIDKLNTSGMNGFRKHNK